MNNIVRGRSYCALPHFLRHEEEIIFDRARDDIVNYRTRIRIFVVVEESCIQSLRHNYETHFILQVFVQRVQALPYLINLTVLYLRDLPFADAVAINHNESRQTAVLHTIRLCGLADVITEIIRQFLTGFVRAYCTEVLRHLFIQSSYCSTCNNKPCIAKLK